MPLLDISSKKDTNKFLDADEIALSKKFIEDGYCILTAEDTRALAKFRSSVVEFCVDRLACDKPKDEESFLNSISNYVKIEEINNFRLHIIDRLNSEEWVRVEYFRIARWAIQCLAGNELVMQRRINMSIQLPGDDSSLLPIHCDVWSGDSPFEVVLWIPLVNCFDTKSMFIVPPKINSAIQETLNERSTISSEDLFEEVKAQVIWINIPYGSVLIFNQNLMHGNRVNQETETRWTMNCRFKGAFTPYADKRLGEFFEPITLRAASSIGLSYKLPDDF